MRRLPTTLLATSAGAVLLLGSLLIPAAPALAHAELIGTDPGVNRKVAKPPSIVVLQFSEQVLELGARVQVTGPSGRVDDGAPRLAGAAVVERLDAGLPAGKYTVIWRVSSDDGHPIEGRFGFEATGPGAGAASSTSPSALSAPSASPSASAAAPPGTSASAEPAPTTVPLTSTGDDKDSRTPGWTIAGLTIVAAGLIAGLIALRRPRARPSSGPASGSNPQPPGADPTGRPTG